MLAYLTRGEVFTCSVHSVSLQLFAHLASCPCLTTLVLVLGLPVRVEVLGRLGRVGGLLGRPALGLGLGELLGRLALGLGLGELLGRLALGFGLGELLRLLVLDFRLGKLLGRLVLIGLGGELLGRLTLDELLAHRVPLSRHALLELLELLARGEFVADRARGDLLVGHRSLREQLELLELAQRPEFQGEGGDGVEFCGLRLALVPLVDDRLDLRGSALGDRLVRGRLQRARLGEHVVVIRLEHKVDGGGREAFLSEHGAKIEESVAGVHEDADDTVPDLRGRDELWQTGPCMLVLHAGAVCGPHLARLVHYMLRQGA